MKSQAENFINNEKQFHLGFLPTEQSNPKTKKLDEAFAKNISDGVRMLQSVDRDVLEMAEKIFGSKEYASMCENAFTAILNGNKIVFSGCGATGRLSILLESMWRKFFIKLKAENPGAYASVSEYESRVFSIMTGGDYALVRSVESFEDYQEFGRQQARETGIEKGDVLIAITEGGETSSVIGTVKEAAEEGAKVFLLFNNPAKLLSEKLERCREAIENQSVTVLDLHCGPMALSGSTRMQATTSEQLIAGAALETVLKKLLAEKKISKSFAAEDYGANFKKLLQSLESEKAVSAISSYIEFEEKIYRSEGLISYYADEYLLDIFTDTTERAPTFMLPPFKKKDDDISPPSWAFVKTPLHSTEKAWHEILGRKLRCLEWNKETYGKMGASEKIIKNPPLVGECDILKFIIGNEKDPSRLSANENAAVFVLGASEMNNAEFMKAFNEASAGYRKKSGLIVGRICKDGFFNVPCEAVKSPLSVMEHLAIKLVLNTVSTGTMVRLGKVTGNWMSCVEVTNKKLMDRGVRIISELCGLGYNEACHALHETLEEFSVKTPVKKVSPVKHTINKLKRG